MLRTLLFINDDLKEHQILRGCLKDIKDDAYLISAFSSADAFGVLTHVQPDLILLDFDLPGANAFEILKKIHLLSASKKLPVHILINPVYNSHNDDLLAVGANGVHPKPATSNEYIKIVKEIITDLESIEMSV